MPSFGVNTAIVQNGQILLTRRIDFDVWCLPGGSVEANESLAEAARRETLEEVGLDVRLTGLVGLYSRPGWLSQGLHIAVFAGEIVGGALQCQASEVAEARFFALDELPEDGRFLLGHRRRALDALAGVRGAVWFHDAEWDFPAGITRQQVYDLCARSGLPSDEYYRRYVGRTGPRGEIQEISG
ncbi:MAG: NUDIX domain-containing protein [Chloroflexota bacterium]